MTAFIPRLSMLPPSRLPRHAFREALEQAPPGIFDPRSWAYWQLVLAGRSPPPPLPVRILTPDAPAAPASDPPKA